MAKSNVSLACCVISHSRQPKNNNKTMQKGAYQANLQEIPWYECGDGVEGAGDDIILLYPLTFVLALIVLWVMGSVEVHWSRGGNLPGGAQTIGSTLYPPGRSCLWTCQGISRTGRHYWNHPISHWSCRNMRNNGVIAISSDIKIKSVFITRIFL